MHQELLSDLTLSATITGRENMRILMLLGVMKSIVLIERAVVLAARPMGGEVAAEMTEGAMMTRDQRNRPSTSRLALMRETRTLKVRLVDVPRSERVDQ